MFKITPNPPDAPFHDEKLNRAAYRAIDHYLNPSETPSSATLFAVTPGIDDETLILNTYETFSSVTTLLLDLSDDLTGKQRDVALAIHQLSELGVLLMGQVMDRGVPLPQTP
ncbi:MULTISPECIES: DUF6124 family protein [unclassified Pseudomonas]|uniref:DUF6124 family protein n=1 Tax=unclassified Pseudomonas TaxID=196821 RepID=UPI0015A2B21F|nr:MULTISPECIES: DUF6124 family protein [unclassified Pseudomonas]NWC93169.1 hypothetical protein [Pseudomonas sp. IPO3779]NWD17227.1 hypothetical protein [Pseudomonas sp. IPO3778]